VLKKVINIVCGDRPVGVVPPADRKFESPAAASLPPPPPAGIAARSHPSTGLVRSLGSPSRLLARTLPLVCMLQPDGWWLMLICSERKVLLAYCLVAGGWFVQIKK
jgi:hypothetical protein